MAASIPAIEGFFLTLNMASYEWCWAFGLLSAWFQLVMGYSLPFGSYATSRCTMAPALSVCHGHIYLSQLMLMPTQMSSVSNTTLTSLISEHSFTTNLPQINAHDWFILHIRLTSIRNLDTIYLSIPGPSAPLTRLYFLVFL